MWTGHDIQEARKKVGESQAQFAARFGVDQSTVHRWETYGAPTRGTAAWVIREVLKTINNVRKREAAE